MALAPPKSAPDLVNIRVAGTMHHPAYAEYHDELRQGKQLELVPDPSNVHDPNAVKILLHNRQIGWVPKTVSAIVAGDIHNNGPLLGVVQRHSYYEDAPYDCRLEVKLQRKQRTPRCIIKDLYFCEEAPKHITSAHMKVGTVWGMHTTGARSSVTIARPGGGNLMWFRKSALSDLGYERLDYERLYAHVLQQSPLIVELLKSGQSPIDNPYGSAPPPPPEVWVPAPTQAEQQTEAQLAYLERLSSAGYPSPLAGTIAAKAAIITALADARAANIPEASLGVKDVLTQTFTKETTMSKFDTLISANKSAAQTGAVMEAGRIANNQVAKLAAKQLPMMVRGYADTAIGKVIIANLAAQGAKYFRPEDTRLAALTDAMMVQAFQVLMQTVDIEGFVDELLDSKDIKRAMSKLSDDSEEAAPAGRAGRAAAAAK